MRRTNSVGITIYAIFIASIFFVLIFNTKPQTITPANNESTYMFEMDGGTYDVAINVIITEDTAKAFRFVKANVDSCFSAKNFINAEGLTIDGEKGICVWIKHIDPTPYNICVVNHELFHVTSAIMRYIQVDLTPTTEEVYAYELDYLTKEFYNHLIK